MFYLFIYRCKRRALRCILRGVFSASGKQSVASDESSSKPNDCGSGLLHTCWVGDGEPCSTLVIGFASLGVLDSSGTPTISFEFVGTCSRAGASHGIFVKDHQQSWYLMGARVDESDPAAASSFDDLVEHLRREVCDERTLLLNAIARG